MSPMLTSDLPLPRIGRGKVRDIYAVDDDRLLLVTTDRISAFDVVMAETIPMKGAVLTIGEPLHFDQYFGRQDDAKVLRYVTNQIAAVIQQMTGQAYVDVYAHRVKSGELTIEQADAFACDRPPLVTPPDGSGQPQ